MSLGRYILVLSLVCSLLAGCDDLTLPTPNVNDNTTDPDNSNDNTSEPGSNDNLNDPSDPQEDDSQLPVAISGSNLATPDDLIELQAHVQDPQSDGSAAYFYSWEYRLENSPAGGPVPISENDPFVEDWTRITFNPQDYGVQLGDTLVFRVVVQEIVAGLVKRAGEAKHQVVISDMPEPTDEGADEGEGEMPGDEEEVIEEPPVEEPPAEGGGGSDELSIEFAADHLHMSLSQEFLPISPTVTNGVAPYTYAWTPIDVLQPGGGAFSKDIDAIDTAEVDFVPDAVGDYVVTLTVTDNNGDVVVKSLDISVNDYSALVASAGEDLSGEVGSTLTLVGSATGGSGDYGYMWAPVNNPSSTINANTVHDGVTTYTLTVTDQETGVTASDSALVVVYDAGSGSCTEDDIDMSISYAKHVAYDPDYGSAGQAIVVTSSSVLLYDLSDNSLRQTLALPASGRSVAVDAARRRGFVSTQISGQFTRSVQVIDLDSATLGCNVALAASTTAARGMDVISSTGDVLIAVAGAEHGLIKVDPGACSADEALQELHNPGSFREPIDVAVLEQHGLSVAVVANGGTNKLTLVSLDLIVETPDAAGGSGTMLPQVQLNGTPRAIVADPLNDRAIVAWNLGVLGRLQTVSVEVNGSSYTGSASANINLGSAVIDQGLSFDPLRNEAYATMGSAGAGVVNLSYSAQTMTLQALNTSALSVVAECDYGVTTEDALLIVGQGPSLSRRCP